MSTIRRAAILKMATAAYEMELPVLRGKLARDDDGRWLLDNHSLDDWLSEHAGEEMVLILGSLEDERPIEARTCRTCGRDYMELECPTCRANRIRLRGRA